MQSFDQSLATLVKQRMITYDEAVKNSTSPSDFALLFRGVSGGGSGKGESEAHYNTGAMGNDDFEIDRFQK